jgi:acyl carrier protein
MEDLKTKLKQQIIEALNLEGMTPDQIDNASPLFGEGLGLDSIDALELIVLLEKNYQIRIEDPKDGRKVFQSIDTMAEFISQHQQSKS